MRRLPSLLALVALVPACASAPAAAPPIAAVQAVSTPVASAPTDPLAVGRKWLFESVRVEGNATDRGTHTIEIVARDGENVTAQVTMMGLGAQPATSGLVTSKAGGTAPFAAWTPSFTQGAAIYDVPAADVSRASEAITVRAGTFQATRLSFPVPSMRSCCFDKLTVELWLADGVGLVKAREVYTPGAGNEADPAPTPVTTMLELVRAS